MRWVQLAHNPEQLLEHFRRLIIDFGATEELANRIHKLFGLLTAAAKASANDSSDLTGSTSTFGGALSLKVFLILNSMTIFSVEIKTALPLLLNDIADKVRALAPGEILIVPGGWSSLPSGHAILFIVQRVLTSEDASCPQFTFTACNTGEGIDRHPSAGSDVGEADKM